MAAGKPRRKTLNEMTKKELLAFAEREGYGLSTGARAGRSAVLIAVRKRMQEKNAREG